jgi:hypothetical protein
MWVWFSWMRGAGLEPVRVWPSCEKLSPYPADSKSVASTSFAIPAFD